MIFFQPLLEWAYWLLKCDGFWSLWFLGLLLSKNDWENYGTCLESGPQWGKELFQGLVWLDTGERKLCQACNLWIQTFCCIFAKHTEGNKPPLSFTLMGPDVELKHDGKSRKCLSIPSATTAPHVRTCLCTARATEMHREGPQKPGHCKWARNGHSIHHPRWRLSTCS